jgi:hypothetical protein
MVSVFEGVAELASEGDRSPEERTEESRRARGTTGAFTSSTPPDWMISTHGAASGICDARTERIQGVPPEVEVCVDDLHDHGTWRTDVDLGPCGIRRIGRLVPLQLRVLVVHAVRVDLDLLRALGLGAIPLRSMGVQRLGLVLDAGCLLGPGLGLLGGWAQLCGLVPLGSPRWSGTPLRQCALPGWPRRASRNRATPHARR